MYSISISNESVLQNVEIPEMTMTQNAHDACMHNITYIYIENDR